MLINLVTIRDDINQKLQHLISLKSFEAAARIEVCEYFESIINEVDIAAEELLQCYEYIESSLAHQINAKRMEMVNELRRHQKLMINIMPKTLSRDGSTELFAKVAEKIHFIRCRFEELFHSIAENRNQASACDPSIITEKTGCEVDLSRYLDDYEQLVLDIIDQTNKLEEMLLWGKSFFFLKLKPEPNSSNFGFLVQLDDFLNIHEIVCLKQLFHETSENNFFKDEPFLCINQKIERSINESSCATIRKPVVVTRSFFTIIFLLDCLWKLAVTRTRHIVKIDKDILDGGKQFRPGMDRELKDIFVRAHSSSSDLMRWRGVERFADDHNPFEHFKDKITSLSFTSFDEFKSFNLDFKWLSPNLDSLCMSYMGLTKNVLNDEPFKMISKMLSSLGIRKTFRLDTFLDLDFIGTLHDLKSLDVSLPDKSFDINIFKDKCNLEYFYLMSACIQDFNIERTILSRETFIQLFSNKHKLISVSLEGFQIDSLDSEMFENLRSVERLSLMENRIGIVDPRTFSGVFDNLKELNIYGNQITRLHSDMFPSLSNLSTLGLSKNNIKTLEKGCFNGLQKLQKLWLAASNIEELEDGVFEPLCSLNFLNLNNNRLKKIKANAFVGLAKLTYLRLDNNPIESIESFAFASLSSLDTLNLENCHLKSISNLAFTSLSNLRDLQLSHNEIESIILQTDQLPSPLDLNKIDLTEREVELIKNHMFVDLVKLQSLKLDHNKLEKLNLTWFLNMRTLWCLDLSHNNINELNSLVQDAQLDRLTHINLANNKLTKLTQNSFLLACNSLRLLDLSNNQLNTLPDDFLSAFENLKFLYLHSNQLQLIFDENHFSPMQPLIELDLSGNRSIRFQSYSINILANELKLLRVDGLSLWELTLITSRALKLESFCVNNSEPTDLTLVHSVVNWSLSNMKSLDFSFNSIPNLDQFNLHTHYPNLVELRLANNRLESFEARWLKGLTKLTSLDVSNNCIQTLNDPTLFENLKSLESINLSGNKLKYIHFFLFKGLIQLKQLDLSNNFNDIKLYDGQFRDQANLETINLSGNNLKSINLLELFKRTRKVKSINLSNNQLDNSSINEDSFKALISNNRLEELDVSKNRIVKIDFVRNLIKLKRLDVSENPIESIFDTNNQNLLGRLKHLDLFNLNGNFESSELLRLFASM